MNNEDLEKEIVEKGLTAPRVSLNDLLANIEEIHFFTAEDATHLSRVNSKHDVQQKVPDCHQSLKLLTFCVIVTKNGFTVTGESACASPENFNAEMGRKIAKEQALNKLWPLMGYALKEKLHTEG